MAEHDNPNDRAPAPELIAERKERSVGSSLVAALVASAFHRGVRIIAAARATGLSHVDERLVIDLGSSRVHALSFVLATGGFERNPRLPDAFLAFPVTPISSPSNEGDGLELALVAGACVADMTAILCPCRGRRIACTTVGRADAKATSR